MKWLLDTSVLFEFAKPEPHPNVVTWLRQRSERDMAISVLTIGELGKKAHCLTTGRQRQRIQAWIHHDVTSRFEGRILDITPAVSLAWEQLLTRSEALARPISAIVSLIAATATAHHLTLIGLPTDEIESLGIPSENPWE